MQTIEEDLMKLGLCLALVIACSVVLAGQTLPKSGPKVFISVDMEGIWGVVHGEQVSPGSAEYGSARRWMAEDVNAVITGLLGAGASEVVVNDSHGSMRNIVADTLNPKAALITGTPKPLSMMQGIDATFDACIFVGYHARAGSAPAILDHTISSATVRAIRINGQELPEMGINAAIAGYYNVPVIMLSGDTETCAQAKSIFGKELVTVPVKEAIGRLAAKLLPAEEARRHLMEAAKAALAAKGKIAPFRLNAPYTFEVEFLSSAHAEPASLLPGIKRVNPRSVTFGASDYLEGFKLMRAIIALAGTI
jgi:D-amino peptidase